MIQLRPLAVHDLSLEYAHNLGNGNIKHYRVSLASTMLDPTPPARKVADYIKRELGEDVEILEALKPETDSDGKFLNIKLMPEVLDGIPNAKEQLEKQKMNNLLHQYIEMPNTLWNRFVRIFNYIPNLINKLYFKHKYKGSIPYTEDEIKICGMDIFPKLVPILKYKNKLRKCTPCQFLVVKFEEKDRNNAIELLRNDLKKLADENLIMGHLCMPSQLELADTIGSGQKQYGLFCYLFVDTDKMSKNLGIENPIIRSEYVRLKNKNDLELNCLLGLKTQTGEGGTGLDLISDKYKIEQININEKIREGIKEEYVKSYQAQRKLMAEITQRELEAMDELEGHPIKKKLEEEKLKKQENWNKFVEGLKDSEKKDN